MDSTKQALPDAGNPLSSFSQDGLPAQASAQHDATTIANLIQSAKRHLKMHNTKSALALFETAYQADPHSAEAVLNYAQTLFSLNKKLRAIQILRQFVAAGEQPVDVLFILAYTLTEYGMEQKIDLFIKEAIHYYATILATQPGHVRAINNLGMCFLHLEKPREAGRCFVQAIRLEGNNAIFYNNLGLVARLENLPDQSLNCCQKAIDLNPNYPEAYNNLGNALKDLNQLEAAKAAYEKAISLDASPDFKCNLALALLTMGDFKAGWKMYEWRQTPPVLHPAPHTAPPARWRGEAAPGKTLLLSCEQGLGDTIQFCRYAPLVKAKDVRVLLHAPRPLVRLLQSLDGVDAVTSRIPNEPIDLQCPLLSLPLVFQTDMATIPSPGPYLAAPEVDILSWKNKIGDIPGYKVGLVWSGQARQHSSDFGFAHAQRSMPADFFLPLQEIDGVRLFNLQKDGPPAPEALDMVNFMDMCHDFADTAALVMHLDLVITVDTAVAHLAGALGKPVWVLNRFSGCWRWLRNRTDSPWYPTLRLFTQTAPGDWAGVMARVGQALAAEIRTPR